MSLRRATPLGRPNCFHSAMNAPSCPRIWMRMFPRSATKRRPWESMAMSWGGRNSTGPDPHLPKDLMNVPSFVNREMRATVSGVAFSPCPEWPSATKISPFGATSTLHGSVRASGGFPAIPARPSVSSTFPSELNFTTVWPLPIASGFFFSSRSFAPRISTTHTLPSRSTYILWGKMNMPAPKLFRRLPDESNLSTGGTDEPAQLSYVNGETPGGTSGFAPHRSATQTDSPSLSIATPFRAPHFLPSGRFPHGATDRYGLGRSLVG